MKAVALVKANQTIWLAIDYPFDNVTYTHHKTSPVHIYGVDETGEIYRSLHKGSADTAKAFGGAKFSLKMADGSEVECHGQWWDAGHDKLELELGEEIVSIGLYLNGAQTAISGCIKKSLYEQIKADSSLQILDVSEWREVRKQWLKE